MPTIKDQLKEDLKQSLKSGDSARRMLIGMVMSSVKNKELEKRSKLSKTVSDPTQLDQQSQLNDEETLEVIASEVKRRKDAATEFEKGNRPELAESERKESEILMAYMPAQMPDDELRRLVQQAVKETGAMSAKDMGKVIGAVMAKVKGTADGQRVSSMVKEELPK